MLDAMLAKTDLTKEELDLLSEIESRDNIFQEIDFSVYCS